MENVKTIPTKPVRPKKTCTCVIVGNGVDLKIGEITLDASADAADFAKAAYRLASASFKKLELPGYQIVVKDGTVESRVSLEELRQKRGGKKAA